MKVGIIVHSHTGNTLSVAERLKAAMASKGHSVSIERVVAVNEDPASKDPVVLKNTPDTGSYDALVFAAPVRAFSLSPVMKAYLAQLSALSGKKVACFVTQQLPFKWMGGSGALGQMKNACSSKGASPVKTGVVNWGSKKREELLADVVLNLSSL